MRGLTGLDLGDKVGESDLRLTLGAGDAPGYPLDLASVTTGERPDAPFAIATLFDHSTHSASASLGGCVVTQKLPKGI